MRKIDMFVAFIVTLVFAAPLLAAAYTDYTSMKIPNVVSGAMLAGFFLTLPMTWMGLADFSQHMAVGGLFFVSGFAMFALGWMGGGDAKLMAGIALYFGFSDALVFVLYTTVVGGALALMLMLSKAYVPVSLQNNTLVEMMFQGKKDMPYGLALAAGAMLTFPTSQIGLAISAI